jgi:uncharacterized repeat protein (TIGR01451 family)
LYSNLTYTINLTNLAGVLPFVYVTNTLDANSTFVSATNIYSSAFITTNGNVVVFSLIPFGINGVAQMTVIVQSTAVGLITNTVSFNFYNLTNFSVNIINQVTNPVSPGQADLAVGMTGPVSQVFSNDWMVYDVSVTNLGPNSATNVLLTNTLPPGVGFKNYYYSPSNHAYKVSTQSSNVIFNLGTLTNQAFINFQLTVQPTNAGTWTFVSGVNTTNSALLDTNQVNNTTNITVGVSNFLSSQLTASIVSTQKFNPYSGRLEQNIALSNAGPTSVDSARIIVTGLTNRLSNAVGTNNGNPFVTYASSLGTNQSAFLLLQFYPNQSACPFTNSQMQAVGVTPPNLAPAADLTPTNVALMVRLPSGGILLTFHTLTNRTYTVEYTSNLLSTNWLVAQPPTVTPANYTYWIDYGPPETVSHPTNTPVRLYRVYLNP